MFSLLILTKNEEKNLSACLESVAWCDDIVVLDSISTDKTCDLARRFGSRVFVRAFDNFSSQRNYALDEIKFRHPWVFHLDADERFNEELRAECERVIAADQHSGYFVPNRIIFLGRWIRHCTQYPHPQVRLLKVGEIRFTKSGHGQREDQAKRGTGSIGTPYDHHNFSKGISEWVEKHNSYSDEEAAAACSTEPGLVTRWTDCFRVGIEGRRAMKVIHRRLPLRWVAKFLYLYFFKRGFLDGYPGFAYCVLQGFYDFLISVKIRESDFLRGASEMPRK